MRVDGEDKFRMPIHNIEGIATFGYSGGASPALMELCAQRGGVALTFLSEHGRFMARVTGRVSGNVLLRRRQYRIADSEEESSRIASDIIIGKIVNCRTVLQRAVRDHGASICADEVRNASTALTDYLMGIVDNLPPLIRCVASRVQRPTLISVYLII